MSFLIHQENYAILIGQDLLLELVIVFNLIDKTFTFDTDTISTKGTLSSQESQIVAYLSQNEPQLHIDEYYYATMIEMFNSSL
jgi:hypothetical protein